MIHILELRCESWILEMMSFVQNLKYIRLRAWDKPIAIWLGIEHFIMSDGCDFVRAVVVNSTKNVSRLQKPAQ